MAVRVGITRKNMFHRADMPNNQAATIMQYAAAAYSLRKVTPNYSESAIRVRRSSDNVEQNIGFATVGANVITNGDFASGSTGWTILNGTVTAGQLVCAGAAQIAGQNCGLVTGTKYWFSFDFTCSSGNSIQINNDQTNGTNVVYTRSSIVGLSGTIQGSFTASNPWFVIEAAGAGFTGTIDNIVLRAVTSGNNGLDIAALSLFIAPNNTEQTSVASGFVTTWYDQSGNNRHALQTTAANQPIICEAGVIPLLNGVPTIKFFAFYFLSLAAQPVTLGAMTFNAIHQSAAATSILGRTVIGDGNGNGGSFSRMRIMDGNTGFGNATINYSWSNSATIITAGVNGTGSTTMFARQNGTSLGTAATTFSNLSPAFNIGFYADLNYYVGKISECLVFNVALDDNISLAIERNQGTYYGITVA